MVPIEKQKTFTDLFQHINTPVILVVGSYLGTVSHTLSALDNLHKRDIKVINVVINEGKNSNKKAFTENTLLLKASIKNKTAIRMLSNNSNAKIHQIKLIVNDIEEYFKKMA